MAKSLLVEEDVKKSQESMEGGGFDGHVIKFKEDVPTPIYILNKGAYEDGFVHWIDLNGNRARIPCAGGSEGKGFAVRDCAMCELTLDVYQEGKKSRDENQAKKMKAKGNDLRAKYEIQFIAAYGELAVMLENGQKVRTPYYAQGENENGGVGILSMTQKQFSDMLKLVSDDSYPFIKKKSDLTNRTLIFEKSKKDNAMFPTTTIKPWKEKSDPPNLEYDKEEITLDGAFDVDEKLIADTARALRAEIFNNVHSEGLATSEDELTEDELGVPADPTDDNTDIPAEVVEVAEAEDTPPKRRASDRK